MRAGQLRHKIVFQKLTVSTDTWSHSNKTWADQVTVWASIWSTKGTERLESLKLGNELTHNIRCRYRTGLHPKMRIKFGTRYFNILSMVNVDERNIYYEIMASEEI